MEINLNERAAEEAVDELIYICHRRAKERGWWTDLETGEPKERNFGELIALVHSELSETLEAHRKDLPSDHIDATGVAEELADALIRIFDMAGGFNIDLGDAMAKKLAFNREREDHKRESRLAENGKKY